jgi:hypothetical protein
MTGAARLRLKVLGASISSKNHLTSDSRDVSTHVSLLFIFGIP